MSPAGDGASGGRLRLRLPAGAARALRPTAAGVVRAARHGRAVPAVLAVAAVLLTAVSGFLGLRVYERHQEEERGRDALAAARQSALNFTSLDYRHYGRDSRNVLKGATGSFKQQFAAQTKELTKLVAKNKSVSEGKILEAGLVRSGERSARVLVVADSKVTNVAAPEGRARNYRLQLDMVRRDGRWLTSDIEFVG
ncbi:hypothetical protein M1E25_13350 [Streptomyces sp. MTZ3.1]|uniref:Mce-associated membrane protein n=2 Tax=Streptomyces meridianus TaxID=2938945 RepID=A0ABT0X738_9ACTN|nr:hypothetical protein [Streptomyces meridianus]